jgi:hypothetical protein
MVIFVENHDYWQTNFDTFSGSQKWKYFIHLWSCPSSTFPITFMKIITRKTVLHDSDVVLDVQLLHSKQMLLLKKHLKMTKKLPDEVCTDDDYETALKDEPKSICSVDFYPTNYKFDRFESFCAWMEEYFSNRKDVLRRVIKCEVVNYGNNVRLVTEVRVKRGWIFFLVYPEANYAVKFDFLETMQI